MPLRRRLIRCYRDTVRGSLLLTRRGEALSWVGFLVAESARAPRPLAALSSSAHPREPPAPEEPP